MKYICFLGFFFLVVFYFSSMTGSESQSSLADLEYYDEISELEEIIEDGHYCAVNNRQRVENALGELEWFIDEGDYSALEEAYGELEEFRSCEDILDY